MLKKIFVFFIFTSLLAGCSTGSEGYMKLSANNKIFDRKGFKGGKRSPLYNKKYVSQAKKNVMNEDYEEDGYEDDLHETKNISNDNIQMYKRMIDNDRCNKTKKNQCMSCHKTKKNSDKKIYPSIVNANNKINSNPKSNDLELRAEIEKIKNLLNDTKKDMASYRCPTAQEIEKTTDKSTKNQPVESLNNKPIIIEPVQSI